MSAVEIRGLSMIYETACRPVEVLQAVDLEISRGTLVCALGPSGSGKTTLLQLMCGLIRPTAGLIAVQGTSLGDLSEDDVAVFRRDHIGVIYQFFNLSQLLSVEENIALPLLLAGRRLSEVRHRVQALVERLGLCELLDQPVDQLSGGEMQRVAIARALVIDPTLILADEPTGNLDSKRGEAVLVLLRELVDERGITTVLMTHDLRATNHADRVIRLENGRIDEDVAPSRNGAQRP